MQGLSFEEKLPSGDELVRGAKLGGIRSGPLRAGPTYGFLLGVW